MGIPIVRPSNLEVTALGAAVVAGVAVGLVKPNHHHKKSGGTQNGDRTFEKARDADWNEKLSKWKMAVEKSLNWDSTTAKL